MSEPSPFRIKTINPRNPGEYTHKYFVVVYITNEGLLVINESSGEVYSSPEELANLISSLKDQRIFLVNEVGWFVKFLMEQFGNDQSFQLKGTEFSSRVDDGYSFTTTLSSFGFKGEGERKVGMHKVWTINDFPDREALSATDFLKYAIDIRSYFEERNEPIPGRGNKGLAAWFAKHPGFWPEPRGRIPKFVNEAMRSYLPGNYNALRYDINKPVDVWAIDMRSAYHLAARNIRVPNWDDMYARGYSRNWEFSPIWFKAGTKEYLREISRYGALVLDITPTYNLHRWTLPVIETGRHRIVVWSNELIMLEMQGIQINGIVAAWTSGEYDTGLGKYAQFAQYEIERANKFRKSWLKPAFHSLYGMLGARPKHMSIGHLRGESDLRAFIFPGGYSVDLHTFDLKTRKGSAVPYDLTNVAVLGMLAAEIRIQMMLFAIQLESMGYRVTHMHADSIHVEIKPGLTLPYDVVGKEWKVQKLLKLVYLNDSHWIWSNGKTLPGVPARDTMQYEVTYRNIVTQFDWSDSQYERTERRRQEILEDHTFKARVKAELSGRRRST